MDYQRAEKNCQSTELNYLEPKNEQISKMDRNRNARIYMHKYWASIML